jgi:hypothetical protein
MKQQIYRQEALDRLSSPDQLDQLMPLTNPRGWIALAGAGLLLLAGVLWAVFGTITVTVDGEGVFSRDNDQEVVLFVPSSDEAYEIRRGAEVRVGRGTSKGESGKHVLARVKSVSRYPVDGTTLQRTLQNEAWAEQVSRLGPCLRVVVELAEPSRRYRGAPCHGHIVIEKKRPISLVLPISVVGPTSERLP